MPTMITITRRQNGVDRGESYMLGIRHHRITSKQPQTKPNRTLDTHYINRLGTNFARFDTITLLV